MLKSLFLSLHNRGAVGKIVGNKTCDVTVGAGNSNLVPRILSLLRESTLVTAGHVSARF